MWPLFGRKPGLPPPDPVLLADLRESWYEFDHLDDECWRRLVELAGRFLSAKRIVGAAGFEVDDTVRWTIALLACLPILELSLRAYSDFVDVIVYPDRFLVDRRRMDEAGVVHESRDVLSGEAMDLGPVVLAWSDIVEDREHPGACVVIHEFVHKLDMANGSADGTPVGAEARSPGWGRILTASWEAFCARLDAIEAAIPAHVDPEDEAADAWYGQLGLDPYAATDPVEFFAVAGEAFFSDPWRLREHFPALFEAMKRYFGQDPSRPAGQDTDADAPPAG
jgi:Mlc titration factor MtfA (ptsG expression regulator)